MPPQLNSLFFSGVNPQADNGNAAEEANCGGNKWEILRAKDHSGKLQETRGLKSTHIFLQVVLQGM